MADAGFVASPLVRMFARERQMQLKFFQEQIFFAIVRITVGTQGGSGASIGTGFLYRVPVSEDRFCILLVSNRHVYGDPKNPIQLIFHEKDPNDPSRPLLGQTVSLQGHSFASVFAAHPEPSVDLACVNVSNIGDPQYSIYYKYLDHSVLPDFEHEQLLPGSDVWFLGYPENRFDTKNNLPILRRGCIASIPKVDFEGRSEFLIDAQVFRGSSGSPVFTTLGKEFKLVGVVAQTMIRNEKVQAVPTAYTLEVEQILGLGIVLKASLLRELLDATTADIKTRLAQQEPEPTADRSESEQSDAADG